MIFLAFLLPFVFGDISPIIIEPKSFTVLRTSGQSTLYTIDLPNSQAPYPTTPLLVDLHGTRHQIGYDYAALLHKETAQLFSNFMGSMFTPTEQFVLLQFLDYCWDNFLAKKTPPEFLAELAGMKAFHKETNSDDGLTTDLVATRFYTVANMPADAVNIISMLEQELEGNWPDWLKFVVNEIIKLLEKLIGGCDAYGVWGSRTQGKLLYTSRNLDWNRNTGIDQFKLVTVFHIDDKQFDRVVPKAYATIGFAYGLGALAGSSSSGITTSEMNLDNSVVTFDGLAFPLRLRYVLERSSDLNTALTAWNNTNNTNSFNFLIGSSADAERGNGAFALETIMGYTSVYPANSPKERDSTYFCDSTDCKKWTNETGQVHIGKPLTEAVWRSNHAFDGRVMKTQEPLFNDTVFRYNLMNELFVGFKNKNQLIDDTAAVYIAAVLGTKGSNFLSCDPSNFQRGENVMSIAYAPGPRGPQSKYGHFYVAWEQGGKDWRPAACNPYVKINFDRWVS